VEKCPQVQIQKANVTGAKDYLEEGEIKMLEPGSSSKSGLKREESV
jgi:hypothetical protein